MALPTEYDGINRWNVFTEETKTTGDLTLDFAIANAPVSVRNDSSFVQDSNTNHKGKKFEYYGQEFYIIDGQVIVENKPVPNVMVSAESKVYGYYEPRGQCTTDENGYYKMTYNEYNQPDNFRLMVEVATKDKKYNTQVKDFVKPRLESNVFTSSYIKNITPDMIPYMQSLKTPYFNYANYGSITSTFTENASFPYKNMVNGNDYSDFGTGRQEVIIDMNTLSRLNYFKIGLVSSVSPAVEMWYSYSLDVAFTKFYDSTETAIPNDKVIEIKMTDTSINTRYVKIILNGTQNKIDFLMATFRNEFTNKDYLVYNNDTQFVNFMKNELSVNTGLLSVKNTTINQYNSIGFKDAPLKNVNFTADMMIGGWVSDTNRFGMSIRQTKPRMNTNNNFSQTFLFSEYNYWIINYYTGSQNSHVANKPHYIPNGWNNVGIQSYNCSQVYSVNGKYFLSDSYFRSQSDEGTCGFTTYSNSTSTEFKVRNTNRKPVIDTEFFDYDVKFNSQADVDYWIDANNCDVTYENGYMKVQKTINQRPLIRVKNIDNVKNFVAEVEIGFNYTTGDNCGLVYNTTAFAEHGMGYAYIMYMNGNEMGMGRQGNNVNDQSSWTSFGSASVAGGEWRTFMVTRFNEYHTSTLDASNTVRVPSENVHKNGGSFGFSGYLPTQTNFKIRRMRIKVLDNPPVNVGDDIMLTGQKDITNWIVTNQGGFQKIENLDGINTVYLKGIGQWEHLYTATPLEIGTTYKLSMKYQQMRSAASGSFTIGLLKNYPSSGTDDSASNYIGGGKTVNIVTTETVQPEQIIEHTFTADQSGGYVNINMGRIADGYESQLRFNDIKLTKVS